MRRCLIKVIARAVEDAAEGILRAAEQYDGSLPVNLGTGEEVRIRDLATMIAAEALRQLGFPEFAMMMCHRQAL